MNVPFIRNHQYNLISKQVKHIQHTLKTVADPKTIEAVKYSAKNKIIEAFAAVELEHSKLLEKVSEYDKPEQLEQFLQELQTLRLPFPEIGAKQITKLFPKVKKLKQPELTDAEWLGKTYLGWSDLSQNKMYIIYELDGQLIGIEGKYTPVKKGVCFVCKRHEETVLFSAKAKFRPAHASPDYYKAYGNYMCADSKACNGNITDTEALEKFIVAVTTK